MEIVGEDGCEIKLKDDGFTVFGRGSGFNTKDRTVSRRHVLFQLNNQTEPRVSFEVVGKNPLWLRSGSGDGDGDSERKIRVFKKLEKGEMEAGDCFCISSQSPVWYNLKKIEVERLRRNSESVEISQIDPVKEFGFLVMGHEFDCYPKQRMRNPKNWDWFLEETKQSGDSDDDDEKKRKRSGRRKRKKNEDDDDDDEWSDEGEDMETAAKIKRVDRPKYSTRSKDKNKGKQRKEDHERMKMSEEEEDEDEDDDTLGGFIVTDEEEEEGEENDEEEEELMEDEEEEELDK